MLIFQRSEYERTIITTPEGRQILISIKKIHRDKVSIGFQADRDIIIVREEVSEDERDRRFLELHDPITEEWLLSIGFQTTDTSFFELELLCLLHESNGDWSVLFDAGYQNIGVPLKKDIVSLCKTLKIELSSMDESVNDK